MQLSKASVTVVSHNGDMSQQNSAALKVNDFNFYKNIVHKISKFDTVPYFVALWSAKGGGKGEVLRY